MKTAYWIHLLIVSLLLTASSAKARPKLEEARYRLDISDRPREKRFVIALVSLDDRLFCIPVEKWPNSRGQVHFGNSWVSVKSRQETLAARDENFGYCIEKDGGPCVIRVKPHSKVEAFVSYSEFGKPERIAALQERRLVFPVTAWLCKPRR